MVSTVYLQAQHVLYSTVQYHSRVCRLAPHLHAGHVQYSTLLYSIAVGSTRESRVVWHLCFPPQQLSVVSLPGCMLE